MPGAAVPDVALLYPGDRGQRDRADPAECRFAAQSTALAAAGLRAGPAVWHDDFADQVRVQLLRVAVVLVWCSPTKAGHRRDRLDASLHGVAARGVVVSAHPEAVLRMGTKDVHVETRNLPFGTDVHRIDSLAPLAAELPGRLSRGPRVLEQHRGSAEERIDLPALRGRLAPYFAPASGGHMVGRAWQPGIADGMVRADLVEDHRAGFGHQAINALHPGETPPARGRTTMRTGRSART